MTRRLFIAMMLAALTFIAVPVAPFVYAQTAGGTTPASPAKHDLQTRDASGKAIHCADVAQAKGGVLLGYIVPCITKTIENSTVTFAQKMIDGMMPAVYAFITFVLVMFGLKIVQSAGQEVHKEGFVLLIKIAFVMGMLGAIPTLVPHVYGMVQSVQEITTSVVGEEGIKCDIAKYRDGNTPLIWAQMDCLIGKLYGFTTGQPDANGNKQPNMLLGASVLGMMGGFFFGGTFGVSLFLVLIGVLWSILQLVLKVVLAFLNGYLIICLMLILSPIFIPLVLLRVTQSYFDAWWKLILASILLPAIVTAYAMFAMLMYDALLFSDKALIKELFNYDKVQEAEKLPHKPCSSPVSGLDNLGAQGNGGLGAVMNNPFMQNFVKPLFSGTNDLCAGVSLPTFSITDVNSPQYKSAKEAFTKLFRTAIELLVMAILVEEGLQSLVSNVRILLGSSAPGASLTATSRQEQAVSQRLGTAKAELQQSFRDDQGKDLSGAGFIKNIPGAVRNSIKGFVGNTPGDSG